MTMKKMEFFSCGSPASTAVCSSLDRRPMVCHGPTRKIDHRHQFRKIPCASQLLPFNPKPHYENHRKSTSTTTTTTTRSGYTKQNHDDQRRKSSADVHDLRSSAPLGNSSRFLLADDKNSSHEGLLFVDLLSSEDHHHHHHNRSDSNGGRRSPCLSRSLRTRDHHRESDINHALKSSSPSSSSLSSTRSSSSKGSIALRSPSSSAPSGCHHREQVVVLMVSLHCKGCEGKVRKHISKMEGVKSFSIDLATKKVIVVGDVSPLDVVASVSKVKSAQLWPSPTPSSSPSPCFS